MYGARGNDDCPICLEAGFGTKSRCNDCHDEYLHPKEKKDLTALVPCGHSFCYQCVLDMQAVFCYVRLV